MIKNKDMTSIDIFENIVIIIKNQIFIIITVIFIFLIFKNPQIVVDGVSKGLNICSDIIIPSLFPFMVVCNFISLSPIINVMSKIFSPITRYIFNLPNNVGCLIFMSFIGGYPMGAKMIANFLRRNEISVNVANRLLCFCVNAGPAFVVTAIGYIMWDSRRMGIYLLLSHIMGSVIIGILLSFFSKDNNRGNSYKQKVEIKTLKYSEAFVRSVVEGIYGILDISAFVIVFSVVTCLVKYICYNNKFICILLSFLEITVEMKNIINLEGLKALLLCSFLISFSGLSVCFQIFYFIKDYNLDKKRFILFRFIHGLISALITYFITLFMDDIKYTSSILCNDNIQFFQISPFISIVIFFISISFITFSYNEIFDKVK